MKILQLTSHLNIGGITRYLVSLSQQLSSRGHRVIVASDAGRLQGFLDQAGLSHWRFPLHTSNEFSPQVFWAARKLELRLRREPVDLIHAHTRVGQVVADRVSKRLKIPYVTTWHGIYRGNLGRWLWPCTGEVTIAISDQVHRHLVEGFRVPPGRVRRVYNGIDTAHYGAQPEEKILEDYRTRWRLPAGRQIIGGIGRLASGGVKGFDLILEAASLLKDSFPELRVMIVGDGPRRPFLEGLTRRLGLRDRVLFVGETQDIRIPLALMDLFIFSSRWPEAFGLTLVEAMAAGKAVVATEVGAIPEIVRQGIDGCLVPVEDPSALAQTVARMLKDPETRKQFGQRAQARARGMFDIGRMASEIERIYKDLLAVQ